MGQEKERRMQENREAEVRKSQRELIGPRYEGASLSKISFGERDAKCTLEWLKKGKNFLLFLGCPGCGKTYFCSAIIEWIYKKVRSFRYWEEREFLSRLRTGISSEKGDYAKLAQYLCDDDFMIYDDLGSCGINEWRRDVLLAVIDQRYESTLPTIFTSNLTEEEIRVQLGPRSHSRLFDVGNTIICMHDSQDQRQVHRK